MKFIRYRGGYKYQLLAEYSARVPVLPPGTIVTEYLSLSVNGTLRISVGYAWDGPSGPTFDTPSFMRGSLEHDALYQLMRMGLIGQEWRLPADRRLVAVCREDGMSRLRSLWVYAGVRVGGGSSASPNTRTAELVAPERG